jgi:hypothetical protein
MKVKVDLAKKTGSFKFKFEEKTGILQHNC